MKKILSITLCFLALNTFAQKQILFTLQSNGDTVYVNENQIEKAVRFNSGSQVAYIGNKGQTNILNVKQLVSDTNFVASTATLVFSGSSGTIDSIKVNGVKINKGATAHASSINATVAALKDSINALTSSPNYWAEASDSTLTIYFAGAAANGLVTTVVATTLTTTNRSKPTFSGGQGANNATTLGLTQKFSTSTSEQLLQVIEKGQPIVITKSKVVGFVKSGSGSSIFYNSGKHSIINVTSTPAQLKTALDAL